MEKIRTYKINYLSGKLQLFPHRISECKTELLYCEIFGSFL